MTRNNSESAKQKRREQREKAEVQRWEQGIAESEFKRDAELEKNPRKLRLSAALELQSLAEQVRYWQDFAFRWAAREEVQDILRKGRALLEAAARGEFVEFKEDYLRYLDDEKGGRP